MDQPDGGSVTLLEQLQRMARYAERYRWLREGDNDELVIQHGPVAPDYHWLPRLERLDTMIDAAMSRGQSQGGK
ncbi:hypothetical protein [Cupriavidus metallidurans]|uniref:hypothetical protein n=1 Tax=Cupriavidus metallidurans TaxID=119219 RepID=UPI001CC981DE|nr:hypothetical protein [Cupriavidus metallidurans]UBM12818.1 hypothetical protein LAI70_28095 [Cupriavidus metallidurans]